jgi:predicted nucleotidyltransferase
VEDQSIKASADDSPRGRAVGFTMAMLQRRFALKNDLISVILFGSDARGEAGEGSDIDILIVAEKFGTGGRFDVFNAIESDLKATVEYRDLKPDYKFCVKLIKGN